MEANLQRRVQRYGWDRAAPYYDGCWREALAPATNALLKKAALRCRERVLDVACGTGVLSLAAAQAVGPQGRVLGTDISENMVRTAAATASALGYGYCEFRRCDAEALPDGGERFDAALCGLGLMYMPDPEHAIAVMAQRLAQGGRLVASVWGRRERCGWAEVFPIIDARVASDVCPLFFRLGGATTLEEAFRAAGLHDVGVERLPCGLSYRSADEACDAALVGGPVALAYARFDANTRRAVRAEYLQSITAYRRGAGYEIPGEFLIARGEKTGLRPGSDPD
jgi:ubiquinone/menaquinone biosynthesis C-methylase UbiE